MFPPHGSAFSAEILQKRYVFLRSPHEEVLCAPLGIAVNTHEGEKHWKEDVHLKKRAGGFQVIFTIFSDLPQNGPPPSKHLMQKPTTSKLCPLTHFKLDHGLRCSGEKEVTVKR